MIRILYGCGLRVGEAVPLQNKDIDWTHGTLLIRAAKGNKDRLVPIIYGTEWYLRLTQERYRHVVDRAEEYTGDIFPEDCYEINIILATSLLVF